MQEHKMYTKEQLDIELINMSQNYIIKTLDKFEERFNKIDARFDKIDSKFELIDSKFEQIDSRFEMIDTKFDRIDTKFDRFEEKLDNQIKWLLGIMLSGFAGIFGLMAHGFHWL